MKQTIRLHTFETNSSSVHAFVVVNPEQLEKIKSREYAYIGQNRYIEFKGFSPNTLVPIDELLKKVKENPEDYDDIYNILALDDSELLTELFRSYEVWSREGLDECYYETFEEELTTPGGEEIVVLGYTGME